MYKLKLFAVRMILALMLSCSMVPSGVSGILDISQTAITVNADTRYNRATVKKVQKKLNRRGYDCGTPDGIRGSKTSEAIRQYQADHDLKVTGTVNASLLRSLNIKPVKDSSFSSTGSSFGNTTASASDTNERTVYITDTGSKYHRSGCRYLSRSEHAISLSDALARGYDACSVCRP